jgi:hypothetical protein
MDAAERNTKRLEETVDHLSDDNQFHFLCVLEALIFAQNAKEALIEVTEEGNL